jgi:hypothetical protein
MDVDNVATVKSEDQKEAKEDSEKTKSNRSRGGRSGYVTRTRRGKLLMNSGRSSRDDDAP